MTTPGSGAVTFRAELAQFPAAADRTDRTADDLEFVIDEIRAYVAALVEGGWSGAASQQFQELMRQVDTNAHALRAALSGIASALRTSYQNYADSEQTNVGNFGHIGVPPPNFA